MNHIGVLTSGGDAPGMNAAIRAVTREALSRGVTVTGFSQGYAGVLKRKTIELSARAVGGILHHGGTMLGSARCQDFCTEAGLARAIENLHAHRIEGLVVIGGNGSQSGAADLSEKSYPVVGVASTIDNDLYGTEVSIGVDTALNTAPYEVVERLKAAFERGKEYAIVVVAEGAAYNGMRLEKYLQSLRHKIGFEIRLTTLGHIQRGGTPGAFDRILATELGAHAATRLIEGKSGILVGWTGGKVSSVPLSEVAGKTKVPDVTMLELIHRLAQ